MCSEVASPRISFSYYLPGDGSLPIEYIRRDITLLDSKLDFEFNISSIEHESSSPADELFSNGIILPIKVQSHKQSHPFFEPPLITHSKPTIMKQIKVVNVSTSSNQLEQRDSEYSKSCRGSKRSSSLNFESKRTSLCPLPLVPRSNSTGSEPIPKSKKYKDSRRLSAQKQHSTSMRKLSLNQLYPTKAAGGVYENYHYIGPVLNVSPKFFAFGSLLLCGLDKKIKK